MRLLDPGHRPIGTFFGHSHRALGIYFVMEGASPNPIIPNRFAIHILAAANEYGAKLISERTRTAMAAGALPPQGHREEAKARALDFAPSVRAAGSRGGDRWH